MSLLFGLNYYFLFFNERMTDALFVGAVLELLIAGYVLLQKKEKVFFFSLLHHQGRVLEVKDHYSLVKIQGEIWKAVSDDQLHVDDLVEVIEEAKFELTLKVIKR